MEWLIYHQLRYFGMGARGGGLWCAADKLRVTPPSILARMWELETAPECRIHPPGVAALIGHHVHRAQSDT